ncbi:hypothetical protein [Nostoc sp. CENA543]|nr:hypothetical protein [Nostoc sp. CENA543]
MYWKKEQPTIQGLKALPIGATVLGSFPILAQHFQPLYPHTLTPLHP